MAIHILNCIVQLYKLLDFLFFLQFFGLQTDLSSSLGQWPIILYLAPLLHTTRKRKWINELDNLNDDIERLCAGSFSFLKFSVLKLQSIIQYFCLLMEAGHDCYFLCRKPNPYNSRRGTCRTWTLKNQVKPCIYTYTVCTDVRRLSTYHYWR